MTETPQEMPKAKRNRYPGPRPFGDSAEDQQIFFGRDTDIKQLFERVIGCRLLVLFGKSGLGKTSLLMAGLFPKLRREKPLLPVPIRLNLTGSPTDIVIDSIVAACKNAGVDLTPGDKTGIWEYLRTSLIWSGDTLLTPVLVFDQFEEIFTLCEDGFRNEMAHELGAIASGVPPDRLHSGEADRSARGARLGEQPPDVKILLSVMEEYLGTLQELSAAIPGLFLERYRLTPLSEEDARLAIVEPARIQAAPHETPFATPCFDYDEAALSGLLSFLKGRAGVIEPFLLQLQCCRAEEIVAARPGRYSTDDQEQAEHAETMTMPDAGRQGSAVLVTVNDLGGLKGMKDVLSQFYSREIDKLSWKDRRRARRLCEEGLLSATGSRLPLTHAQIESDYGLSSTALAKLAGSPLIHREKRLDDIFYEISHDRLAESIRHSRRFRIPKKLRPILKGAALVAAIAFIALLWWNHQLVRARLAADEARTDAENLVSFLISERLLEKLRPVGRNAILEEVQSEVQSYLDKRSGEADADYLRIKGQALRNKADILLSQGHVTEALEYLNASIALLQRISEMKEGDSGLYAELARSYSRLGNALVEQGRVTDSLEAHRSALHHRATVYGSGQSIDALVDLADSHASVGRLLNRMGRPRQAIAELDKALELLPELEDTAVPPEQLLQVWHNVLDNQAESLYLIDDGQGARQTYDKALTIVETWFHHYPLSAEAIVRRMVAISRKANAEIERGAVAAALNRYEDIHRLSDDLSRWDETNLAWRRDYAATRLLLGEGRLAAGDTRQASMDLDAALAILHELSGESPGQTSLGADLAWAYQSRGRLALQSGDREKAARDFGKAREFYADAASIDPANATWKRSWAWSVFDHARSITDDEGTTQKKTLFRKARTIIAGLFDSCPEMTVLRYDLAILYKWEITALENNGDKEDAVALGRERDQFMATALTAQPMSTGLLNEAYFIEKKVADKAKWTGQREEALAGYRSSREKARRTKGLEPDNVYHLDDLRNVNRDIASILVDVERWDEALQAYREALSAAIDAADIATHSSDRAYQVYSLQLEIGRTLARANRHQEAVTELELAFPWVDVAIARAKSEGTRIGYSDDRGRIFTEIARSRTALQDIAGAEKAYRSAADSAMEAYKAATDPVDQAEYGNDVFLRYIDIGDMRFNHKEYASAQRSYESAKEWIEKAIRATPEASVYYSNLSTLHQRIARTKDRLGDTAGAKDAYRKGVEVAQRSVDISRSKADEIVSEYEHKRQYDLYAAHNAFAKFFQQQGEAKAALAEFELAIEALKHASELEDADARYPDALRVAYALTSELREDNGDFRGAEADLKLGAKSGELAADLDPSASSSNYAGIGLVYLGHFYQRAKEYRKALEAFSQAAAYFSEASNGAPEVAVYTRNLSYSERIMGNMRDELGEAETARADYESAIRAGKRSTELDPENWDNWQQLYSAEAYLAMNVQQTGDNTGALKLLEQALQDAERSARLLSNDSGIASDIDIIREQIANIKDMIEKSGPQ